MSLKKFPEKGPPFFRCLWQGVYSFSQGSGFCHSVFKSGCGWISVIFDISSGVLSHFFSMFFSKSLQSFPCLQSYFLSSFLCCMSFLLFLLFCCGFLFFLVLSFMGRSCHRFAGNVTVTTELVVVFFFLFLFLNVFFSALFHVFSISNEGYPSEYSPRFSASPNSCSIVYHNHEFHSIFTSCFPACCPCFDVKTPPDPKKRLHRSPSMSVLDFSWKMAGFLICNVFGYNNKRCDNLIVTLSKHGIRLERCF